MNLLYISKGTGKSSDVSRNTESAILQPLLARKSQVVFPQKKQLQRIYMGIMVVMLSLLSGLSQAQTTTTISSSQSFVVPAGVTSMTAYVYGAGGGSGGCVTGSSDQAAGGGGGGACAVKIMSVLPGETYTITIGAGGTAGAATGTAGGTGGTTTISGTTGGTVTAAGGGGGGGAATNGASGTAGVGATTGSGFTTIFAGGNGTIGYRNASNETGGAGGGGGGNNGIGGNGSGSVGANSIGGTGGAGTPTNTAPYKGAAGSGAINTTGTSTGVAGTAPGGGAAGSASFNATAVGAVGGAGQVVLVYTLPVTNYYLKAGGNVSTLADWGTNTAGTTGGPAPAINSANIVWNIVNNAAVTNTSAWALGSNSKIIVGDGTTVTNFTVPATFPVTGTVDVTALSKLTLQNATVPTLGILASSSTVEYASTSSQTIAAVNYGNLSSSSTGARVLAASGTIGIAGTFTPFTNTYTITGSTINFTSASSQTIPAFDYANISNTGNGPRVLASSGNVRITGLFTPGTGLYTVTGSNVRFTGTASLITPPNVASGYSFNILIINGSGTYTLPYSATVQNLATTLTLSGGTLALNTGSAGTKTVGVGTINISGGTLDDQSSLTGTTTVLQVSTAWNHTSGVADNTGSGVDRIQFIGGGTTTFTGLSGAASFEYYTLQVSGNTILNLASNVVVTGVTGTNLTVDAGSTYNAGTFTTNTSTTGNNFVISGNFNTANLAGFSGAATASLVSTFAPTITITGSTITYNATTGTQTVTARTDYNDLVIAGGSAKTLAGPATVAGVFTLTSGILTTTSTNLLTINNTATTAIAGGSTTSFVNGPLNWKLPASLSLSTNVYNVPVGNTTYLPMSLTAISSGATGPTIQFQAFSGNAGGTGDNTTLASSGSLSTTEYWSSTLVSGSITNGSLSLTRQSAVSPYTVIGKSVTTTRTGTYKSIGGNPAANSINGSTSITAGGVSPQYYVLAQAPDVIVSALSPASFLNTTYGTQSSNLSFTLNGSALIAGVTVTAPVGFEVSLSPGSGFGNSVVAGAAGNFSATVYVRLKITDAAGSYSGNITLATPGKTIPAVVITNSVVSQAAVTITANNQIKCEGVAFTFTGNEFTNTTLQNGETLTGVTLTSAGAPSGATAAGSPYAIVPSAPYTGTFTAANYNITFVNGTFTVKPNHTITASAGSGGSISPNGVTTLCDGATQGYTITPADACHSIANVIVDGVPQGAIGTYTFTNITGDHTISASFVIKTYTITATAGANGSITPATGTVNCGDNATYTITPNACYSIADVLVDGLSVGAVGTYTFSNVTANHTISATFSLNTYTITVSSGANGSITPASGTINCGDNATYTITPDACYSIADVLVDGLSVGAVGTYTFTNVNANHTISATFSLNTYNITVTAGANGSITPGSGTVNCGSNATYTITADACYSIADVLVDGVSVGAVGTYTFTNVSTTHTISATFSLNTYTITVSSGANGSVTPASGTFNCGDNATYTITPDACYSIADVLVDGLSVGAVGTYTFSNVTANHTISATFSLNTYTITVSSGANGSITPASGTINCGDNATYTITPDACYSIADVLVDGLSVGAVGTYTFTNVNANHTISATFSLNTYNITVTAGANGSITPGSGTVNCGSNATYTITADACYSIADVLVDGVSVGAVGTYTFTNVSTTHTISATFSLNTYTITVSSGANGSVTPASGTFNCGDNATYTITPDACYSIADVLVDGLSVGAVGTYTFSNVTANHTISAAFSLNTYTITVTAGANGSVTPATGSVNCGDNATYTITADACYSIADVLVDGVSVGAVGTYTFTNVTANHTISATFSLNTYTITVSSGANGSVTPSTGSVNCGDNATYTITPNACYSIADVVVDGVSQGAVGTFTFTNVTANHTISATFSLNTYTITVSSGANGSVTPASGTFNCGDNATYTITPDACYSIADVLVDGLSVGAVGTYTFSNVTANHTISATFSLNTYTITVSAGANGSITPATGSVNCGDNATYTITADACYSIADVLVDGLSVGAVGTYTFSNVTANHTISATFSLNTYTITVSSGTNGSITPTTGSVNCGDNATYTITPDACYSIADVLVDGLSVGAVGTYTFTNVSTAHTISATFSLNTYTITVSSGANGSITPGSGTFNCGDNATYTITPDACYSIADVLVDGISVGAVGTYTFTNVTANHTISATFSLNTYIITVTAGANGSVTPATGSVNCGDNATYTITADACYSVADVLVDGLSVGAVGTYTFTNVTANHTISATFSLNTYTITVSSGTNGSITPTTGSVNCGDNATYTITPDACYSIADVLVDGVSVGAVGTYTFTNVSTAHTISATFSLNTYTITVSSGANGSITPGSGTFNCGDNATYTITADACYSIADVLVDGVSVGAVGTYTFSNVTANHTISATFSLNTYTITVSAGANGSITPATGSVNCGDNTTYTITANTCYSIADVLVDGLSVGAVGTYTFSNITTNHTISATFSLNTYTITVSSGTNGSITPTTGSVNCGDNATYTITPDACYSIADVLVDGLSVGAVGTYTFSNVTASHTISATFSLNTYTITVSSGANGSVTPATGSVNCGDNATYTITPNACYSITDVLVDGVSVGAVGTYTFTNVTANHTISATFSLNTYTITVSSGANGSVTPATGSVNCGDNATYIITPNACYSIADVLVDGVSVGTVGTYTFTNVTANHTISATFSLNTYTITVSSGANGSVTPATGSVNCGDNATYTITPNACYSITDVLVDGVSVGAVGTYTFTNVTANHTISATFSLNTYTITVSSGANGSVTPVTGSVNCGNNATYTITPATCYHVNDVLVDGVSVGAVGTYTFTNVTANHTISATFSLNTYTITVSSGANGTVTPSTGSVNCGDNATYTITPNACYSIADVVVDGVSQGAVGTYTFTNVTANHTISATFTVTTYNIAVTSGANGSVTPGTGSVNCGANQTYTITPATCYHVNDVLVDGVSVGAVTTYTFTNVTANHTISASFAINATLTVSVSGIENVCPYVGTGTQITYTATSAGATGFTWVVPPTNVTIISGQGTANLTVTFQNGFTAQNNKQLRVTALSSCGNSPLFIYYLLAQAPSTPAPISASNSVVCAIIGTPATITYTIPSAVGATSYIWTNPAGTTITHTNGTGINDTTITLSFNNTFVTSNLTVASANGCGTSSARSIQISRISPSTPGLISGPTNACPYMAPGGTLATYTIVPVSGATSYTWTVPAGAIGFSGQGTTSISFTFPSTFTSGNITVTATNGCGTSASRTLAVARLNPATPGVVDVIQTGACPNRVYTYTIASTPANATTVQWTVPAGATLVNGQGGTSITVSYPATSVAGFVTAQALNNCGNSTIRKSEVRLPACPPDEPRSYSKGGTVTAAETMTVNVYPNPSVTDFKFQVITAGKEKITVRILDMQGRAFKNITVAPNQTISVGSDLKAGSYLMEVRQGESVKTTKLIKF